MYFTKMLKELVSANILIANTLPDKKATCWTVVKSARQKGFTIDSTRSVKDFDIVFARLLLNGEPFKSSNAEEQESISVTGCVTVRLTPDEYSSLKYADPEYTNTVPYAERDAKYKI